MNTLLILGFIAGVIQLFGYMYYIQKTQSNDISPNPTTWIIFAFDTVLLTILEAVAGATLAILFLPIMCSLGALYVAWLIRKSGRLQWPIDKTDNHILKIGIFIAITYAIIFILWHFNIIPVSFLYLTGIIFLILSNTNTFVAFIPIIRDVYKNPLHEHAGPWTIWTVAYGLLTIVTYQEVGFIPSGLIFYLYPVSCVILHGIIAYLARDSRKINYEKDKSR